MAIVNKRHKCTSCRKVRFEKFMEKTKDFFGTALKTRYNQQIWYCADNKYCEKDKERGYY